MAASLTVSGTPVTIPQLADFLQAQEFIFSDELPSDSGAIPWAAPAAMYAEGVGRMEMVAEADRMAVTGEAAMVVAGTADGKVAGTARNARFAVRMVTRQSTASGDTLPNHRHRPTSPSLEMPPPRLLRISGTLILERRHTLRLTHR